MKTTSLITTIAMCAFTFNVIAQQPPPPQPHPHDRGERAEERKENIESMKIGFITQKLDLTPTEAQQFWPVYNQYSDKMDDLRKKRREDKREAKRNFDELSDKEVEQQVDNEIIFRQKELDIQKEYHAKFKSVLSIKKVAKLYAAEEEFKMVLLNKLKDRDRDRKPGKH